MGTDEQDWLPKFDYYLDESDPDVVVLRRQGGAFVAAFSARGATREGIIEAANKAWRRFASDNGAELGKVSEGANYLGVCDGSRGEQSEDARSFAEGLRAVLSGTEESFAMEYSCHSPTERRWFLGSVGHLADGDTPLALVAHENVTGRRVRR